MLYTSTSEVYGDALIHPQNEGYYGNVNSFGKRSCYDESKRIAESLVYSYIQLYNLDLKTVRIFNTYGPHMDLLDGRIVTEIIKSFLLGSTLNIYGTGLQTRSLCYVDDTIKMIVKVMNSNCNEPINVGSEFEISINDLVKKCQDIFNEYNNKMTPSNLNLSIVYTELEKDDPKVRKPCLLKNKKIVGEINYTSLDTGLKNTLMYFKDIIDKF
jgi:UDP-glucuronate decarboxylase